MELSINELTPIIELILSAVFMAVIYFKFIRKGDKSKKYLMAVSIGLFIVYLCGNLRIITNNTIINKIIWQISFLGFGIVVVSLIMGALYILNTKINNKHKAIITTYLIILTITIIINSNDYTIINNRISWQTSAPLKLSVITGLITIIIILILFIVYGLKNKNYNAIMFGTGAIMLTLSLIINTTLKEIINYQITSIIGLTMVATSFLIKHTKKIN